MVKRQLWNFVLHNSLLHCFESIIKRQLVWINCTNLASFHVLAFKYPTFELCYVFSLHYAPIDYSTLYLNTTIICIISWLHQHYKGKFNDMPTRSTRLCLRSLLINRANVLKSRKSAARDYAFTLVCERYTINLNKQIQSKANVSTKFYAWKRYHGLGNLGFLYFRYWKTNRQT